MPTALVNPYKFRKVLYDTPQRLRIDLYVEASAPINVYLVNSPDIDDFKAGYDFSGEKFTRTKKIDQSIRLPDDFYVDWYLVLENRSADPVAVHYEVSF